MIQVNLYYHDDSLWRFRMEGHAGYAEHGFDIICAAASLLAFNTINAIEAFTEEPYTIKEINSSNGLLDVEFPKRKTGSSTQEAELLLKAMILGLDSIEKQYGKNYIKVRTIRR